VCPLVTDELMAVGQFYADFRQVEDAEVVAMLAEAAAVEPPGEAV
jgi:predicted phosphoribosyltransferase